MNRMHDFEICAHIGQSVGYLYMKGNLYMKFQTIDITFSKAFSENLSYLRTNF